MSEEVISLPPYFKQLEYLESKGSQYIDTGYIPNNETGLYLKVYRINGGDLVPAGARTNDIRFYPPRFNMNSISIEYGWGNYYNIGNRDTNDNLSYESWLNFCNSRKTSIQTQSKFYEANLSTTLSTISHTIYIFDWNYNGSPTTHWAGKIYRVKISQGDTIVKDFVPALNLITNKPCMFDLITQTAYYNQGSGEFAYYYKESIISIPYGYKRCTFLESSGTQYINTNYVATNNTGAYAKWSLTNIKNYSNVLSSLGISTDDTADSIFMLPHWNGDNNTYLGAFMSRSENILRLENQTAPTLYSVHESHLNYYNNSEAYIDTTLMGSIDNTYENLENDLPLYLFGCNKLNSLSTNDSMIGRIYRVIITEGEEVVMDLIPCLDDNGKPCMYDLVTQTPFYNANAEGSDFRYVIKDKIPSGYKRVEYLENTSKSYINTNYIPNNETGLYIEAHTTKSNDSVPMGSKESDGKRIYVARNTYNTLYGWNTYYNFGLGTTFTFQRYKANTNFLNSRTATFIINDEIKSTKNLAVLNYTPTQPFYIFGINNNGVLSTTPHIGKIYRAKISQGTEIVRDFVPTLDENGIPCMFDLVEGIPYYNVGSGEFLYNKGLEGSYTGFGQLSGIGNRLGGGVDGLPPAYTRVNYLESTGIENIKLPTPNLYETHELFTVVTDCQFLSENKTRMGFIARGGLSWGTDYTNNRNGRLVAGGSGSPFLLDVFGRNRNVVTYSTTYYFTEDGTPHPSDTPTGNTTWTQTISVGNKKSGGANGNGKLPDTWDYGVFLVSYEATTVSYPIRIWSCKCWCDSVSYDLIPCLDDNGRPCMFDRISRKPFYNSGTGEFLYG